VGHAKKSPTKERKVALSLFEEKSAFTTEGRNDSAQNSYAVFGRGKLLLLRVARKAGGALHFGLSVRGKKKKGRVFTGWDTSEGSCKESPDGQRKKEGRDAA